MQALQEVAALLDGRPSLDRTLAWSTGFARDALLYRGAAGTGDFGATLRDAVRMLDDLGVSYVLIGATALGIHGYVRATENLDFMIFAHSLPKVIDAASRYRFREVEIREAGGTFRPNRITLKHGESGVKIQFVTHKPEALEIALNEGETIPATSHGVQVVGPSLAFAILTKMLRGEPQDDVDVWKTILRNPKVMEEGPEQKHILHVISLHPDGSALTEKFLQLLQEACKKLETEPDKYGDT